MAIFDPGTGGTLKSTTLEAAFIEVTQATQPLENAAGLNNVTITYDSDALTSTINATIPVTSSIGAGGAVTYVATNSLSSSFLNGGGDLGSSHHYAAILETAYLLQAAESNLTTPINNVSVTINDEAGTATVAGTLPITIALSTAGKPEISAVAYAV